jgi:hypothetical protein
MNVINLDINFAEIISSNQLQSYQSITVSNSSFVSDTPITPTTTRTAKRRRTNSTLSTSFKSTRRSFTLEKKLEILESFNETNLSKNKTAELLGISLRSLNRWNEQKAQIITSPSLRTSYQVQSDKKRVSYFPALENKLAEYLNDRISRKRPTMPKDLLKKSREFAVELILMNTIKKLFFLIREFYFFFIKRC